MKNLNFTLIPCLKEVILMCDNTKRYASIYRCSYQIMLITLLSPFVSADDVETSGDVSNGTSSDGNYTVSSGIH